MFFIFSLLVHALFFVPALKDDRPSKASFKEGVEVAGGAKYKQPVTIRLIPKGTGMTKTCPGSYSGVGVMCESAINECMIVHVPEGYPAHRAGVKAGDIAINYSELRGKAGTPAEIIVRRDGVIIKYKVIREVICETK